MSRVYVAPVSFGLGDLVVSLPAVQALVERSHASGDDTWLVARSPSQEALAERIEGLSGCVSEEAFDRVRPDRRFIDLRDHPLQRDYWWGSASFEAAFGKLSINEILARICADFGIEADFTRPRPLTARRRGELASTVLLVADTDGPSKRWPASRWAVLAAHVRDCGFDVRVVTRSGDTVDLGCARFEAVPAPSPGAAVDVLSSARAVVGVDTGLTHIAAQQEVPTITICRADPVYFRAWSHTRAVTGDPCDDACTAGEDGYAYNSRVDLRGFQWRRRECPSGARCLDPVQPAAVMAALEQVL